MKVVVGNLVNCVAKASPVKLDPYALGVAIMKILTEPKYKCRNRHCRRAIHRAGYCEDCARAWRETCEKAQKQLKKA